MLKKQANSISIKLYFYTCWDSDDEDFWDYEVFYTCVPLKPGDINSATWAYWIISSISYYPLWLRLYSLQKCVGVDNITRQMDDGLQVEMIFKIYTIENEYEYHFGIFS